MKNYTVVLQDAIAGKKQVDISCKVLNESVIKREFKKIAGDVTKWLLFGTATVDITDNETGAIIAEGNWACNVFAGQSSYNIKLI